MTTTKETKKLTLLLLAAITMVFSACEPEKVYVSEVTLNTTDLHVSRIGYGNQLIATIHPENADNQNIVWHSNNPSIATVDEYGWVTAVAQGTTIIEVITECGAKTARCVVTVTQSVESIALSKNSITLLIGASETLTATILPAAATDKSVTWNSSNTSIATIDAGGRVTARARGTATITATTVNGKVAECTVTTATVTEITDAGVVIEGVRWATRNVDRPGTFVQSPEDAGMFYQWNRRTPWPVAGNITGWSGAPIQGRIWTKENDPCPTGWRVPTDWELRRLSGFRWTTINGVNGGLFGTVPNQIFMPAPGHRYYSNGLLNGAGTFGEYWGENSCTLRLTNSMFGGNASGTLFFGGYTGGANASPHGNSIRCVAEN
jgi:hypothetical protein